MRDAPPLIRKLPSGSCAIAIGPRMPSLWAKPVANDWASNGWSTVMNSDGLLAGGAAGTPCCAWVNSGLVEGWTVGAGGMPKLGGVVLGTVGSAPRFTVVVSCGTLAPAGGSSWLPATSVASARNV